MKLTKTEKAAVAVLFSSGEPIPAARLGQVFECDDAAVHWMMQRIMDHFEEEDSPLQVLKLDDQYQMTTREEYRDPVKKALEIKKNQPLSQAAMEVLAIVAYNQPVTKSFVEQVRGVDSSSTVNTLVERGLLEERGRLELPGRPVAYGTTAHFLRSFGLSGVGDLPMVPGTDLQMPEVEGQVTLEEAEVGVDLA